MRKFNPLIVVALGILTVVAGVVYGVFAAGIPGPDDSPAEAARVSQHGNISFAAVCAGVLCFLAGTAAGVIRLFSRKKPPQA
jgi:hypothetical protein